MGAGVGRYVVRACVRAHTSPYVQVKSEDPLCACKGQAFCSITPTSYSSETGLADSKLQQSFCLPPTALKLQVCVYLSDGSRAHVAAGDLSAGPYAVAASSYLLNNLPNLFLFEMGS